MVSLLRRVLVSGSVLAVLGVLAFWIFQARESDLFRIRTIEITGLENTGFQRPPVSRDTLLAMLGIQKGQTSLFDVSLSELQEKFVSLGWIHRVDLRKRFPSTFSVHVEFRKPLAFVQGKEGELQYVDEDGVWFGPADAQLAFDLPVITFSPEALRSGSANPDGLQAALEVLKASKSTPGAKGLGFEVSSLEVAEAGNLRVIVTYPLLPTSARSASVPTARALIPWSQEIDAEKALPRIAKVIQYLRDHSIPARVLWLGDGKKIIVKTARGS